MSYVFPPLPHPMSTHTTEPSPRVTNAEVIRAIGSVLQPRFRKAIAPYLTNEHETYQDILTSFEKENHDRWLDLQPRIKSWSKQRLEECLTRAIYVTMAKMHNHYEKLVEKKTLDDVTATFLDETTLWEFLSSLEVGQDPPPGTTIH